MRPSSHRMVAVVVEAAAAVKNTSVGKTSRPFQSEYQAMNVEYLRKSPRLARRRPRHPSRCRSRTTPGPIPRRLDTAHSSCNLPSFIRKLVPPSRAAVFGDDALLYQGLHRVPSGVEASGILGHGVRRVAVRLREVNQLVLRHADRRVLVGAAERENQAVRPGLVLGHIRLRGSRPLGRLLLGRVRR